MFSTSSTFSATSQTEWEPAFGEYGWLWISLVILASYIVIIRIRNNRSRERARVSYEAIWGQREGESIKEWKTRVKSMEVEIASDDKRRRLRVEEKNKQWAATRGTRGRGDFEPPGGWGAMGPG